MWTWLRAYATAVYGTFWLDKGFREYEFVYGRQPFAGMTTQDSAGSLRTALGKIFKQTSTHWGQGKLNAATTAWAVRQLEVAMQGNATRLVGRGSAPSVATYRAAPPPASGDPPGRTPP